jgi:hypothetical protein
MVAVAAGGVRCRNAGAVVAGGVRCCDEWISAPQINALLQKVDVVEHCEESSMTRSVHLAQHARRRS